MSEAGKGNLAYNEAETSLVDRCGFCNKPKRPEKSTLCPELCQCPSASESTDPSIRVGSVPSSAFRRPSANIVTPQTTTLAETNLGLVEIVSVREKHGYFRKAIPRMPLPLAVLLCLFNVILPGTGTFLSVIGVICGCSTEHGSKRKSALISLLAAFLQLVTAPIIVGWIWSVLWGITFVNVSVAKGAEDAPPTSML